MVEREAAKGRKDPDIREVTECETNYFVKLSVDNGELEDNWPDQQILVEMARLEDEKNRQEEVAKNRRRFWAEEILLSSLWDKIKLRKELTKWSKDILMNKLTQVILMRQMIINLGDVVVEKVEKKVERLNESEKRRINLLELIGNRMKEEKNIEEEKENTIEEMEDSDNERGADNWPTGTDILRKRRRKGRTKYIIHGTQDEKTKEEI